MEQSKEERRTESIECKYAERMKKLKELHLKRVCTLASLSHLFILNGHYFPLPTLSCF